MLSSKMSKTVIIAAVIFIAGATMALAGGWGRGHMFNDRGYGYGAGRCGYGYGPADTSDSRGYRANLTDEQIARLDAARDKFFKETDSLRKDIRDKRIALYDAINAENPDKAEVAGLQKELSQLNSQFDELAVQHRLEMRSLLPEDAYAGFGPGSGRGYGRGMSRGFGGGYCWR